MCRLPVYRDLCRLDSAGARTRRNPGATAELLHHLQIQNPADMGRQKSILEDGWTMAETVPLPTTAEGAADRLLRKLARMPMDGDNPMASFGLSNRPEKSAGVTFETTDTGRRSSTSACHELKVFHLQSNCVSGIFTKLDDDPSWYKTNTFLAIGR